MQHVALCRVMNWTWTEFLDQPLWFVKMMLGLLAEEKRNQSK